MANLNETLEDITLFRDMSEDDLSAVIAQTVIRQFPKNTVIVSQGDETDSFYVILQGKVDVFLHNDKGKEIIINTLGERETFGELAPLGSIPRQASIITTEESTFGIISRQVFMDTLLAKPSVSMQIIDLLINRIQDLTEEASRVGATREMVHRILKELKTGGYISIEGKHITIEKKLPPGW